MILLFLSLMIIPNNQTYGQECFGGILEEDNTTFLMSAHCNHPLLNSSLTTFQDTYIPDNTSIPFKELILD